MAGVMPGVAWVPFACNNSACTRHFLYMNSAASATMTVNYSACGLPATTWADGSGTWTYLRLHFACRIWTRTVVYMCVANTGAPATQTARPSYRGLPTDTVRYGTTARPPLHCRSTVSCRRFCLSLHYRGTNLRSTPDHHHLPTYRVFVFFVCQQWTLSLRMAGCDTALVWTRGGTCPYTWTVIKRRFVHHASTLRLASRCLPC